MLWTLTYVWCLALVDATASTSVTAPRQPDHRTSHQDVAVRIEEGWDCEYVVTVTATIYDGCVKTVTITIPEELDARAAAEARRRGISKSELFRRGLDAVLPAGPDESEPDLWRALAGFASDGVSAAPGEVDEVVYGT
jgi:Ribbon-helix-helix protein, copG family